ncbi:O-methyltransferase [Rubripirellula amarantea]|nr:O-methyltransferase [Rubripirellula amarantea]
MTDSPSHHSEIDNVLGKLLLATSNSAIDFDSIIDANHKAGLPAIDVSPLQGKLLQLLVQISAAKRVLEIGTLGGYSTAWMATGLPEGGKVTTVEVNATHAGVAASNLKEAGLADRVTLRLGQAAKILDEMINDDVDPFDFVFIDADKPSGVTYFEAAMKLTRPGSVVVCDNVVRSGQILDLETDDPDVIGTQQLLRRIADEPRVCATAIQTVGQKGHDGFAIVRVNS